MLNKKVLLVEDDNDLSQLISLKLNQAGLNVDVVQTGSDALEYFNKYTPDYVIMDIILPDIDGLTVLNELSERPETKKIPMIILSNVADDGAKEQAKAIGEYEYFVKAKTDLNDIVDKILKEFS